LPLSTTCILIFDFGMFRLWYFGMFRQCGILKCSDSVVFFVFLFYFRAIPTVWYFGMFRLCDILECSDSVVFILECSDSVVFWNVPTVWYLFWNVPTVWYFGMFRQCGICLFFISFPQVQILTNKTYLCAKDWTTLTILNTGDFQQTQENDKQSNLP
jgi:hypothetical protein